MISNTLVVWSILIGYYRPQTKFAKVMFLHLSVISVHQGGGLYVARGCMCGREGGMPGRGGVRGRGACMHGGEHAWQGGVCGGGCVAGGVCVAGGMHGRGHAWKRRACVVGGMCGRGVCMAAGCAWQGGACVAVGHAWRWHVCHASPPSHTMRYGRSMRGRYASYWNAFLLFTTFPPLFLIQITRWWSRRLFLWLLRGRVGWMGSMAFPCSRSPVPQWQPQLTRRNICWYRRYN